MQITKQLYQGLSLGWNDRKKPSCKESNCFMAAANKPQEREIKLKVSKERFNVSEKERLTEVESRTKVA